MDKKTIIFYGFTDNNLQETTKCNDLKEAHKLFNEALNNNKYSYMDITINSEVDQTSQIVRKYSR